MIKEIYTDCGKIEILTLKQFVNKVPKVLSNSLVTQTFLTQRSGQLHYGTFSENEMFANQISEIQPVYNALTSELSPGTQEEVCLKAMLSNGRSSILFKGNLIETIIRLCVELYQTNGQEANFLIRLSPRTWALGRIERFTLYCNVTGSLNSLSCPEKFNIYHVQKKTQESFDKEIKQQFQEFINKNNSI